MLILKKSLSRSVDTTIPAGLLWFARKFEQTAAPLELFVKWYRQKTGRLGCTLYFTNSWAWRVCPSMTVLSGVLVGVCILLSLLYPGSSCVLMVRCRCTQCLLLSNSVYRKNHTYAKSSMQPPILVMESSFFSNSDEHILFTDICFVHSFWDHLTQDACGFAHRMQQYLNVVSCGNEHFQSSPVHRPLSKNLWSVIKWVHRSLYIASFIEHHYLSQEYLLHLQLEHSGLAVFQSSEIGLSCVSNFPYINEWWGRSGC